LAVLVGVDEGADAFVREHLRQQPLVHLAVDDVDAGHAGLAGGDRVARLGELSRRHRVLLQRRSQLVDRELALERAVDAQALGGGDVDEFDRAQRLGDLERDRVRVDPKGVAVAVQPQRWDDRHDAVGQQRVQKIHVDALHPAREQVVDALQDPERVRDHGVGARAAQVGRAQPFEDPVGQAVGRGQRELERVGVGDARAFQIRRRRHFFVRERLDLGGGAVHQHGADVQRPKHRDVHQDVAEVVVGDHRPVDRHDERLLAELRDVAQDAPEVGRLHLAVAMLHSPDSLATTWGRLWGPKGSCPWDQVRAAWPRSSSPACCRSRNR
jgi:hypothetical protein